MISHRHPIAAAAKAVFLLSAAGLLGVMPAQGAGPDHTAQVAAFFEADVADWIASAPVVDAIRAQNERHAHLSQEEIDALDQAWRAEIASESNSRPFVEEVMASPVSAFLKEHQRAADWMIVEIILMDAKGLNVGLSTPSSDYWQGDEDKHAKTYQAGSADLFIDAVEYEAETRLLLSQVNRTIFDPETGAPIGAVTVSVNMNKL